MVAVEEFLFLELLYGIENRLFLICDKCLRLFAHNCDKLLEKIFVHFHSLAIGNDQGIHCDSLTLACSSKDTDKIFLG